MPHIQWQGKIRWIGHSLTNGGLTIPIFHETGGIAFLNSSKITSELKAYHIIEDNLKKLKTEIKSQ